jgi:adenine-specific DNA-methyltransferase
MSFTAKLTDLLKRDKRFVDDEGDLLLAAVQDRAWKIDHELVKLLISDKEVKAKFFDEIAGHWVFNVNTFIDYLSQKNFLDNSYTRFGNRIGLGVSGRYVRERGEVALVWPYKDCVLEGGQTNEEEKREEILFNEILAEDEINRLLDPKVLTKFMRFTEKGKQPMREVRRGENHIVRENLVINGNNLLAIHSLAPLFRGQIKLIYIDPPFNTGTDDFGYNDTFNHSTWLTFMKNRLQVARELLSDDGSLYVHLDFNEVHYCKVLLDEIFGRQNFQREIVWRIGWVSGYKTAAKNWIRNHDTILFYTKRDLSFNKEYIPYPDGYVRRDGKAPEGQGYAIEDTWNCSEIDKLDSIQIKSFDQEKTGFLTQKNEALLRRIIFSATNAGDIVLDFCAGSGTTGATAHKMGRQWILVEQMESQVETILTRMQGVLKGEQKGISKLVDWKGGGDFIYCQLMKYNEAFMDRIKAAETSKELMKIWLEMAEDSFLNWYVNPKIPEDALKDFEAIGKEDNGLRKQKRLLAGLLDKNQLYVNLSEIDDARFKVTAEDKRLNKAFYGEAYNV